MVESIYEAIIKAHKTARDVTLTLASGAEFFGKVVELSYFTGNKIKTPRLVTMQSGNMTRYIDSIKIDVVEFSEDR